MRKVEDEEDGVGASTSNLPIRRRRLLPPRVVNPSRGTSWPTDGPTIATVSLNATMTVDPGPRTRFGWQRPAASESSLWRRLGARVRVGGAKTGVLLFYGETQFAGGVWCGIRLDEPVGKNDGTVRGVHYFSCESGHGIFAPPSKVAFEEDAEPERRADQNEAPSTGPSDVGVTFDCDAAANDTYVPMSEPTPGTNETFDVDGSLSATFLATDNDELNLDVTFTVEPMESTPLPGRVVPALPLSLTLAAIHEPQPDEESVGAGRQWSVDLDESFGILTPNQMKDFTVAAEIAPAETPSDEGIQELAEEEVADEFAAPPSEESRDEDHGIFDETFPYSYLEATRSTLPSSGKSNPTPTTEATNPDTVTPAEEAAHYQRHDSRDEKPSTPRINTEDIRQSFLVGGSGAIPNGPFAEDVPRTQKHLQELLPAFDPKALLERLQSSNLQGLQDCLSTASPEDHLETSGPSDPSELLQWPEAKNSKDLQDHLTTSSPSQKELMDRLTTCPKELLGRTSVSPKELLHLCATSDPKEQQDLLASSDPKEQQELRATSGPKEQQELRATSSPKEQQELQATSGPNEQQDLRVTTDPKEQQDLRATPSPKQLLERRSTSSQKELQDHEVAADPNELQDLCATSILKEILERMSTSNPKELKDFRVTTDPKEQQDLRATSGPKELLERRSTSSQKELQDLCATSILKELLERMSTSNPKELNDIRINSNPKELRDLRVTTDPKELRVEHLFTLSSKELQDLRTTSITKELHDLRVSTSPKEMLERLTTSSSKELLALQVTSCSRELQLENLFSSSSKELLVHLSTPGAKEFVSGPRDGEHSKHEARQRDGDEMSIVDDRCEMTDGRDVSIYQDMATRWPLLQKRTTEVVPLLKDRGRPVYTEEMIRVLADPKDHLDEIHPSDVTSKPAAAETCHHQLSEKPSGDGAVEYLIRQMAEKQTTPGMAASATSIDTGYQGDAECDLQSDANTPVDDGPKEFRASVAAAHATKHMQQRQGDAGSDSDFCSDMAASWTESDPEAEDRARGRGARVIDGRLYFGTGIAKDAEATVAAVLEDEPETVSNETQRQQCCHIGTAPVVMDSVAVVEDCQPPLDQTPKKVADTQETVTSPEGGAGDRLDPSPKTSKGKPKTSTPSKKGTPLKTPKSKTPDKKKEPSPNKFKTPKKNVVSKIKAMIEATSNKLVSKEVSPNKSVDDDGGTGKKPSRLPKKNRWDAVMSKIAAGQADQKAKTKKEVASKIDSNLVPLKVKSPMAPGDAKKPPTSKTSVPSASKMVKTRTEVVVGKANKTVRSKGDTGDGVVQSRVENAKGLRPSALPIGLPRFSDPRSPGMASTASGGSRASTVSQSTLASQTSTRMLQEISIRSMGSNVSVPTDKSMGRGKAAVSSGKRSPPLGRRCMAPPPTPRALRGASLRTSVSSEGKWAAKSSRQKPDSERPVDATPAPLPRAPTARGPTALRSSNDRASHLRSPKGSQGPVGRPGSRLEQHSSAARKGTSQEVSRLEALCESRTKELNLVRMQLKHCALGFDSLAVLLQHLTRESEAFSVTELCAELHRGQEKLRVARVDLEEARGAQERLRDEIALLQRSHQQELDNSEAEAQKKLQEALHGLADEHCKEHESLKRCHDNEMSSLASKHAKELNALKSVQEERVDAIDREHREAAEQLRQQHLREQTDLKEAQLVEIQKLTDLHREEKAGLCQQIEELNGRYEELEKQHKSLEDVLSQDTDYRLQIVNSHCSSLEKEVESLKVVLEMRQSEIQDLRRCTQESKLQGEELALAREEIKRLTAKTEDLQARMHTKIYSERQLLSDNERLKESFEKEAYLTKRLSMENEELKWRIRQSKEFSITLNPIDGASGDGSDKNGGPPCSMSMYFWDNEGLGASTNGSFSPLKTPAGQRVSPHGNPRLSPNKASHQGSHGSPVGSRPLSAPLWQGDRSRPVSTSEDDGQYEGGSSGVGHVKLRDKPRRLRATRNSCPAATTRPSVNRLSSTSDREGSRSPDRHLPMVAPSDSPSLYLLESSISPFSSDLNLFSLPLSDSAIHGPSESGEETADPDGKMIEAKVFFGEVETNRYAATYEDLSPSSEVCCATRAGAGKRVSPDPSEDRTRSFTGLAQQSQLLFWSFPREESLPSPGLTVCHETEQQVSITDSVITAVEVPATDETKVTASSDGCFEVLDEIVEHGLEDRTVGVITVRSQEKDIKMEQLNSCNEVSQDQHAVRLLKSELVSDQTVCDTGIVTPEGLIGSSVLSTNEGDGGPSGLPYPQVYDEIRSVTLMDRTFIVDQGSGSPSEAMMSKLDVDEGIELDDVLVPLLLDTDVEFERNDCGEMDDDGFECLITDNSKTKSHGAIDVVDQEEWIDRDAVEELAITETKMGSDFVDDEASRTSSEPLDSFSIASSSLGAAVPLEPLTWGSIESAAIAGDRPKRSPSPGSPPSHVPKKTTTLVITFRAHALHSVSSSRGSSPVPPATPGTVSDGSGDSSRSGDDTASTESSPRASPVGPEQPLPNEALKLLETSLFGGTRSPRTSAGEAMVVDELAAAASQMPPDPSHLLLKKALQDQLIHDGPPNRNATATTTPFGDSPMEPCGRGPSLEDSPLPGLSKPDTPESTSLPVAPTTDSTNCDVSWSDDDLPSETEV